MATTVGAVLERLRASVEALRQARDLAADAPLADEERHLLAGILAELDVVNLRLHDAAATLAEDVQVAPPIRLGRPTDR
jgi:hypothetical protein